MTTRELTKLARRVWPEARVHVDQYVYSYWVADVTADIITDGISGNAVTVVHVSRRLAVAGLAAALRAMAGENRSITVVPPCCS